MQWWRGNGKIQFKYVNQKKSCPITWGQLEGRAYRKKDGVGVGNYMTRISREMKHEMNKRY